MSLMSFVQRKTIRVLGEYSALSKGFWSRVKFTVCRGNKGQLGNRA